MFLQPNMSNFHVAYADMGRHWSPESEPYAGGDHLLSALLRGWECREAVHKEEHWHAGVRCVNVYHFTLQRGAATMTMPVVSNPYVDRLLFEQKIDVRPFGKKSHRPRQAQNG